MRAGRPRKPGKREPNGRHLRDERAAQDAAMSVVLARRATTLGLFRKDDRPFSQRETAMLRQPWLGDPAGLRIAGAADVVELWGVMQDIRKRRSDYVRTQGWPQECARIAKLLVAPTDGDGGDVESRRPDMRSEDERARDAERAYDRLVDAAFGVDPLLLRWILAVCCRDEDLPGDLPGVLRVIGRAMR